MSTFDKREEAYEAKFAHDETLRFKAFARRDKYLALWAAEKLGLADANAYVTELISTDIRHVGEDDVFEKIRGDFDAAGVAQSDHQIRRTMDEFLQQAMSEIHTSG